MATTERPRARPGWPRTLYGRLVLLLLGGMLLAQTLTGTIWFDARYERVMEMPTRLAASEVAQALRLLESARHDDRDALAALQDPALRIAEVRASPASALHPRDRELERLLRETVALRLGGARPLHLRQAALYDDQGHAHAQAAVFGSHAPEGRLVLDVQSRDGRWLRFDVRADQAGLELRPAYAIGDYLLRIYAVRALVIVLLAWAAVHWITRPLTRLAQAAQALGEDVNSPPLPVDGPREVRQAADAFNRMQARVLEALGAREQLLAAVSHDLRSPITRLRLRVEMLDDDAQRERLRADLAHMQALVDSILDHYSGQHEDAPPQQVDLDTLLDALGEDLRETGATVEIGAQSGLLVSGYAGSLRRAIGNLMENAVRYGQRARVTPTPDADGHGVFIRIDDDGPGIPDDALEQVVQPFVRLERSRSRHTGGIGLGLSIADGIVRAHGGRLQLRNRRDGDGRIAGLQAEVWLPRQRTRHG